ncbi:MAG: hypothetical protein LBE79_09745 [Tannerella sp.]|jgi:hypothetical protein|nr:hypothetical protein [Tannerella sp.]
MKKQIFFLLLLIFCISCTKKEKLIIGGSGWQQIAIVDKKSGKIEWSHGLSPDEECNKVEVTPKGDILYAYKQGAKLINRKQQVIWDFKANEGEEIHYVSYSNGNYVVAVCGIPARIVELDKEGKPVKEVKFQTGTPNVHNQFRQILKTPQNTYLIPLMGKYKVSEMTEEGRVVNSVLTGGTPFSVKLSDEGNWLVSCGEGRALMEIDPETKEKIKIIQTTDLNWGALLFVAELIRYKNGNTLIANWNGHSSDKSQPLLLEINPSNQIVWRLPFNPAISNISTVFSFFE